MLISYKHRFIFIHNYKVAGTSIRSALKHSGLPNPPKNYKLHGILAKRPIVGRCLGGINKVSQRLINRDAVPSFSGHAKALDIKRQLPEKIWDDFFKFGFVRNPWDWQVSLYHYAQQRKSHFQYELMEKMDFEEYIEWRVNEDKHLQKEFFCDEDGKIIVDYIGKIENIDDEFRLICNRIGIDAELPNSNRSVHKNYREYYNDYTRNLVAEHFKEDIEIFGYKF